MAGDRNRKRSRWPSVALVVGGMTSVLMLACFIASFIVLGEREAIRALWLLGIGFFLALVTGVSIAVGLIGRSQSIDYGVHVRPYGAMKYSPGPSTPYVPIAPAYEAHGGDGGD